VNYRSVADLNSDLRKWVPHLPDDLDLVVGVPRSGMLAAILLGLHLNLPVTDVEGLCEGRVMQAGPRIRSKAVEDLSKALDVLVLDDSVHAGSQIEQVKAELASANLPHNVRYAAVYVAPPGRRSVDLCYQVLDSPTVFEWNVMHHSIWSKSCVDIDGVLCRNPKPEEDDDGDRYTDFLANAKPLMAPTWKIGWLVTGRLEKYREPTERWLDHHGIRYDHLVMMDLPDRRARLALGNHASFKASVYRCTDALLFIESSQDQAQDIVRLSGRPVFCPETGQMIEPDILARNWDRGRRLVYALIDSPLKAMRMLERFGRARLQIALWEVATRVRRWRDLGD